ncbi:MAG: winged helix-turn-helix transcriptional regulator [Clostridia bacterium]|nr:winged helix-turn-helix transcriptional regulator [Clostridia bacterium]
MTTNELAAKLKKIHLLRRIYIQKSQPDAELYFGQLPILEYIRCNDGCTQIEIAEKLCVTPASISTSTKRLQKAGLLVKKSDPDNLRCNRLSITEEGISRCDNNRTMIDGIHELMFKDIPKDELEAFDKTLSKILHNMAPDSDSDSVRPMDMAALAIEVRRNEEHLKKQQSSSNNA